MAYKKQSKQKWTSKNQVLNALAKKGVTPDDVILSKTGSSYQIVKNGKYHLLTKSNGKIDSAVRFLKSK